MMSEETLKGPGRDKGPRKEDDGHGLERMATLHLVLEALIHSIRICE